MASPIGHTLVGIALARRLGVRSPVGTGAAVVAASLPDIDTIASWAMHGDPWKMHRKGTHTIGFALTSGMVAGFAGIVSAGTAEGERDLIADAMTGALLVGSHIVIDKLPIPYLPIKKGASLSTVLWKSAINWGLDAVLYGLVARAIWPAESPEPAT